MIMTDNNIPSHLPKLKNAPEGYHWEYRGKGWNAFNKLYAVCHGTGYWAYGEIMTLGHPGGDPDTYYVELVKDNDISLDQHVRNADKLLNSGQPLVDHHWRCLGYLHASRVCTC